MSHPGHSSMAPPPATSSFAAAAHHKGKAPPPPAFCMPVLPVPKTEEDRKKRHSTPAGGSLISHAPPQHSHQQNSNHASLAVRPPAHTRPAIPEVKFSTTGGVPTYDKHSGLPPQVPSSTASALISPRQLNPNPESPLLQTRSTTFLAPQPQQPLPRPPRSTPTESGGASGSTRSSRSLSQPPAPSGVINNKTPEQLTKEIESLHKQLQASHEENQRLAKELAAANRKIEELGGKPRRKKKVKSLGREEKAKKKEMDKIDREEEKRRKEKEKEDKKEKEEREKREREEKEKRDKEEKKEKEEREKREKEEKEKKEKEDREEKERKEKEEKLAKKQAKKKEKQATGEDKSSKKKEKKKERSPRSEAIKEEKKKEKKAKKKEKKSPRDQESTTEIEKKKKGSKRGSKKNKASGEKEVNVGAPKEGAWISTKAASSLELGGSDTPPPSREELVAENRRALEIIEGDGKEIFTPEVIAEIDGLVAQEESEVDALLQAISGLERLALVYEKSGEDDLRAKAEQELNEKKDSANLKGYLIANLLNKKAIILYSDRQDTGEITTRQEVSPISLPEPPTSPVKGNSSTPAAPTATPTPTSSGNREPPRPPSFIMPPPGYEPPTANILKLSNSSEEEEGTPTYVIGLYPFAGTSPDEVPIKEGDRIRLIEKVCDTWWKGANRGVIGLFPANYVRMEQPNEKTRMAVAIFDRAIKDDSDQLSFKQGDKIRLLDSPGETEEWVKGRLDQNDSVGWLPKAYIQITDS